MKPWNCSGADAILVDCSVFCFLVGEPSLVMLDRMGVYFVVGGPSRAFLDVRKAVCTFERKV